MIRMNNVGFCGTDLRHKKNKQTNLIDSGGVSNMGERENWFVWPSYGVADKAIKATYIFSAEKKEGNWSLKGSV